MLFGKADEDPLVVDGITNGSRFIILGLFKSGRTRANKNKKNNKNNKNLYSSVSATGNEVREAKEKLH